MLGQRKWLSGTLMDVEQTWLSMMPPLMLLDFMIWTSLFSLQSQLILAVASWWIQLQESIPPAVLLETIHQKFISLPLALFSTFKYSCHLLFSG
ncbi:uncharacterized protein [Aegilops tauschii subsp. strangulata]|uniref:uncharacterized protein n=1 Tax=Aegilops tauschii subsp. strangulata TaxID=200361 RepID=UPI003CC8B572